jgi:hypothetical protein
MNIKSIGRSCSDYDGSQCFLVEKDGEQYFVEVNNPHYHGGKHGFDQARFKLIDPEDSQWVSVNDNHKHFEALINAFEKDGKRELTRDGNTGEITIS